MVSWQAAAAGASLGLQVGQAAGLFGGGGSGITEKALRHTMARAKGYAALFDERAFPTLGVQEGLLRQATAANVRGYDRALSEVAGIGEGSRNTILDREQMALGASQSSLTSRGLGGTTVLDNAARGIGSDTSRRLIELDDSLAQLFSGLQIGRGQAEAGGLAAQAAHEGTKRAVYSQSFENWYNANNIRVGGGGAGGSQQASPGADYGNLAALLFGPGSQEGFLPSLFSGAGGGGGSAGALPVGPMGAPV